MSQKLERNNRVQKTYNAARGMETMIMSKVRPNADEINQ